MTVLSPNTRPPPLPSVATRSRLRAGTLSAVFAGFMLAASALPKLAGMPVAAQTMADLGWSDAPVFWIGVMEAGFAILFLWPRTALFGAVRRCSALFGAIMMMGVLGSAMATQIRADSPLFPMCFSRPTWGQ